MARDKSGNESEGGKQVSEVASMDPAAAGTPISDDQATAGYPDSESGGAQEGTAGPNAAPRHNPPATGDQSSDPHDSAQGV